MRRFREALAKKLDDAIEASRRDIPAGQIRDQLIGGTAGPLPPSGNTGTGYTPGDTSVTTGKIVDSAVTLAKIQDISTDRLLGRDTASTGDVEQLTVGGGVEFTGSGGIQRSALTGDVAASAGSGSTTIANDAVSYAKMQNVSAASKLLGRGDSGSGDPQEISLGTGLTMTGTTLSSSGGGSSLTVEEVDGSPTDSAVTKIVFPNGTLGIASHVATYTPASTSAEGHILIVDQKTAGTNGGTFTSGAWQTRDLNTEKYDTGNHASVSSNQITLAAGTYRCHISAPALGQVLSHQTRLRDITNTATLLTGTSELGANGYYHQTRSLIIGRFTLSGSTVLEVQHYCGTTANTTGFGTAANFGEPETYTVAEFWREV